jgi:hypothetical protein
MTVTKEKMEKPSERRCMENNREVNTHARGAHIGWERFCHSMIYPDTRNNA